MISRMRGRRPSRRVSTYDFDKFPKRLHVIEQKLGGGRGVAPESALDPPLDYNLVILLA